MSHINNITNAINRRGVKYAKQQRDREDTHSFIDLTGTSSISKQSDGIKTLRATIGRNNNLFDAVRLSLQFWH